MAYAFPPTKVQVAPVAMKIAAELDHGGYTVDLLRAERPEWLSYDDSCVDDYIKGFIATEYVVTAPSNYGKIGNRLVEALVGRPDRFVCKTRYAARLGNSPRLRDYKAMISIGPFHSVHLLGISLKHNCPHIPWIAMFADPWSGNPLEKRFDRRLWNRKMERTTVRCADCIIHSSKVAAQEMKERYRGVHDAKICHISHAYDPLLYDAELTEQNSKLRLTFLGTFYGDRTPDSFLRALQLVELEYPGLMDGVEIDFYGDNNYDSYKTSCKDLKSVIRWNSPLSYRESLKVMTNSDLLLLIEGRSSNSPFVPSKLFDYLGAQKPIIGIVPDGEARDILLRLGHFVSCHDDIRGIGESLVEGISQSSLRETGHATCNTTQQASYSLRERRDLIDCIGRVIAMTAH